MACAACRRPSICFERLCLVPGLNIASPPLSSSQRGVGLLRWGKKAGGSIAEAAGQFAEALYAAVA